jgi:hypothetical protein
MRSTATVTKREQRSANTVNRDCLALGFSLECGEASPLWVFSLGFLLWGRRVWGQLPDQQKPKEKTQSGDVSPHSIQKPKIIGPRSEAISINGGNRNHLRHQTVLTIREAVCFGG